MRREPRRYLALRDYLFERHGARAYKIALDGGFTCPNKDGTLASGGCSYCEPATLTPTGITSAPVRSPHSEAPTISEQIERGIEVLSKRRGVEKFIAFFQVNSSTYAPVEHLRKIYSEALAPPTGRGLGVSRRDADCVGEEILDLFEELTGARDFWLELGLQSANDRTLKEIGRGHTSADFARAVRRAAERGIKVCAHVIIGLPGEGPEDYFKTMDFLSSLPVWGVKFHQLQIVKGTRLAERFLAGELRPPALDAYARLVVECLERVRPEMVIHRLVGDSPEAMLLGRWGPKKFTVTEKIETLMTEMDTRQGRLWRACGTTQNHMEERWPTAG